MERKAKQAQQPQLPGSLRYQAYQKAVKELEFELARIGHDHGLTRGEITQMIAGAVARREGKR